MTLENLWWQLLWLTLANPFNWLLCLFFVSLLWKWLHAVGVVLTGSALATFVLEGFGTRFRFRYEYDDLAIGNISRHLLATLVISTVLAVLMHLGIRAIKARSAKQG